MDKKSKIFLWVFFLLIIGSVGATYWKIVIKRDYIIESQIDCDPYEKNCFIWECDSESSEEGEACTGDPEKDIWYYAVVKRNAAKIPLCDPEIDESCDPWTCVESEKDCKEILCSEITKEVQGVECIDTVQYAIDNPVDEESECAEGDEECLAAESEEVICEEGDEECLNAEEDVACDSEQDPACVTDDSGADDEDVVGVDTQQ